MGGHTSSKSENFAYAAQDSVSYFKNRLIVAAGARHDYSSISSTNKLPATPVTTSSKSDNWSSKFGVVGKPLPAEGIAFYYNHSNTFRPVNTVDSNTSSPTYGEKFPDQIGLANEVGIKVDMLKRRIVGNVVYFDSWLTNQLVTVVAPNGVNIQQPLGKVTARGWECDFAVQATPNINFIASYSNLTARTITGLPLRGNPQKTMSFLGRYSFKQGRLKGFAVAAGYRFAGDRAGDNNATFTTPDLQLYNLNLIYARKTWRVQVNIDNLLDDTVVSGSVDVSRIDLYNQRNVTIRLARTF